MSIGSFGRLMCVAVVATLPPLTSGAQVSGLLLLEGTVVVELEGDHAIPVRNALVEVYRLDIKGYWSARTDASGYFAIAGLPNLGTYLIIASGPDIQPIWVNNHVLRSANRVEFVSLPGDGRRLTPDQIQSLAASGRSRSIRFQAGEGVPVKVRLAYTREERASAVSDIESFEREVKRAQALQASFDRARDHYNKGVESMNARWRRQAIEEFEKALDEADKNLSAHPAFAELSHNAFARIAEINYQIGFGSYIVFNQRYGGRTFFDRAIEMVVKAIELGAGSRTASAVELLNYHRTLAGYVGILIEHYADTDQVDNTVQVIDKASFTDPTLSKQRDLIKGDLYRQAGRLDEAVAMYGKVLALDQVNLDALYGISLALVDLGRRVEAAPYVRTFLKKAPETDDRLKRMRTLAEPVEGQSSPEARDRRLEPVDAVSL